MKLLLKLNYKEMLFYLRYTSLILLVFLIISCKTTEEQPLVLTNVLSHNDYEQPRPLLDALDAKINYVEVDLALQDNELYVTHTVEEIKNNILLKQFT